MNDAFDQAVREHDSAIARSGLYIWIGAEPTFTNPHSHAPEWLTEALGGDKQGYAERLLARLRDANPGSLVLRSLGRQYALEDVPRWSLGLYLRRDGEPIWVGPPDCLSDTAGCEPDVLHRFWQCLAGELRARGWQAAVFRVEAEMNLRVVCRRDDQQLCADPAREPRLSRPSIHGERIPPRGVVDELALQGDLLVALGCVGTGQAGATQPCLELPAFPDVATFLEFVDATSCAARDAGLTSLAWRGFPPPVDEHVAWTTLTPDPAVIEVNLAPSDSVVSFLSWNRTLHHISAEAGLAPSRLHYNGAVADSGGGGQITLGGPSATQSPFFIAPQLLPRLIAYMNRHPSLSYWFASDSVGSASQAPRPDEGIRESFLELDVALEQLARSNDVQPETLWRSLSPFLTDPSGNAHRSELNIEKLWNPLLPGRGCLGLVEFRAFRMARTAEAAAALVVLLRAVAAMLSKDNRARAMVHWGDELHDRFALPFYLRQDLNAVLADLASADLALGKPIEARLREDHVRDVGKVEFRSCCLQLERANEFWPLVGDVAAQEGGGSRLVDASTARLQVSLRPLSGHPSQLSGWQLWVNGYRLPLRDEQDHRGPLRLFGVRYRSFVPWRGLHPGIGTQTPLQLLLMHPTLNEGLRVIYHEWRPDGEAYDGLPKDLDEAARRRSERFIVETVGVANGDKAAVPPAAALSEYCLDLRRLG